MKRPSATLLIVLLAAVSTGSERQPAAQPAKASRLPARIDTQAAVKHIRNLCAIGPRVTGTSQESAAGDYIVKCMKDAGCAVSVQTIKLPGGRSSRNVVGRITGRPGSEDRVIICAHYDTVSGSPGANDNASGVAVMLELARVVPKGVLPYHVDLIGFGAEEIRGDASYQQRYGSGKYAASLTRGDLRGIVAVVSLDMVGAGEGLKITNGGNSDMRVVNEFMKIARSLGASPAYMVNATSDHSAFESRGISAARLRWWPDRDYHKPTDTPDKIVPAKLDVTGRLMLTWLGGLSSVR